MPDPARLAELMCARLCHDIAGPLGTLTGMLELAQAQPGTTSPTGTAAASGTAFPPGVGALADVAAALRETEGRIHLLRAAWGGDSGSLGLPRLREFAVSMPGADRIRLDLSTLPQGAVFAPGIGRILINLLLFAPEVLPLGGTFTVTDASAGEEAGTGEDARTAAAAGGKAIVLRLTGPRGAWPAGFAGFLADPEAAQAALREPHTVLGPWIALLAVHLGVRASVMVPVGRGAGPAPLLLEPRHLG